MTDHTEIEKQKVDMLCLRRAIRFFCIKRGSWHMLEIIAPRITPSIVTASYEGARQPDHAQQPSSSCEVDERLLVVQVG